MQEKFVPVKLEDADLYLKAEYGEYCAEKFGMNEIPLGFEQWQLANHEMAE